MYNGAAWDMLCYKSLKWANGTGGGVGGELPYIKDRVLERTCKRYQDYVMWVWLEFFFTFRGTNFKTSH